jgi:hypothetical protein
MSARVRAWLRSLLRPFPLTIGVAGYGSALGVKTLPFLASYAASWYWLLLLAGVCHSLLAWHESYRDEVAESDNPWLGELLRLRGKIAARVETVPTQAMKAEIPQLIAEIDHEILPRLRALAVRHCQLGEELAAYRNPHDRRIKPSPPVLRDLQHLYDAQQAVMKDIVQEVADIDATLSGFMQEGDEQRIVRSMQAWKTSLGARWHTLKELLER